MYIRNKLAFVICIRLMQVSFGVTREQKKETEESETGRVKEKGLVYGSTKVFKQKIQLLAKSSVF